DPQSAPSGGELGWVGKGGFVPQFENAANAMAIGQISDPIKTDYGYHVIQVEERRGPAQNDIVKRWLASKFTEADIKWHSQHDLLRDLFTKRQQATVVSPVAQVHVAQIQVATPRPVGGDFQAFTDQLKKVADVGKALDAGTDFAAASRLHRHAFSTFRPVAIVLDAPVDWALVRPRYPAAQPVTFLEPDRSSTVGQAERDSAGGPRFVVLAPLEPFADLASVNTVLRIVERLRAPDGCPWDREQTHV